MDSSYSVADQVNDFRAWIKRRRMSKELSRVDNSKFVSDDIQAQTLPNARLQKIIDLLTLTPMTVPDIARALGLNDSSTIFKIVKKYPQHFQVIGQNKVGKHTASVWGVVSGSS